MKKKFTEEELHDLEENLRKSWIKVIGDEKGFTETWQVVQDAAKYSFNASHSLSVAIDALYGAYLKTKYPLEYMTVALDMYSGDEKRTNNLTDELKYFKIKLRPPKFRYSRAAYTCQKEERTITKGIGSIKYLNEKVSEELYELRDKDYDSFYDLLVDLEEMSIDSRQTKILIKVGFFEEFGSPKQLLWEYNLFKCFYGRKQLNVKFVDKTNSECECSVEFDDLKPFCEDVKSNAKTLKGFDLLKILQHIKRCHPDHPTSVIDRIKMDFECLGYSEHFDQSLPKTDFYVVDIVGKRKKILTLYSVATGKTINMSSWGKDIDGLEKQTMISVQKFHREGKNKPSDKVDEKGKTIWYKDPTDMENWLDSYLSI